MSNRFPFAVRLIGFSDVEEKLFDTVFASELGRGYGYVRLLPDNLQDPDFYVINADELKTLVSLSVLSPSEIRPALLVGSPGVALPYPCMPRPIEWHILFEHLDALVEKRADALSRLQASDIIAVTERRRLDRLDLDLTDPSEYDRMRRESKNGGVLSVDKSGVMRDYLVATLTRYAVPVYWVNDEIAAANLFHRKEISVVLINTSTPFVDPYRLCDAIKKKKTTEKITVIFLANKEFIYDTARARSVGCDGFLLKPLASQSLFTVLKKFLPLAR